MVLRLGSIDERRGSTSEGSAGRRSLGGCGRGFGGLFPWGGVVDVVSLRWRSLWDGSDSGGQLIGMRCRI
jgi:hypothetical protein